MKPSIVVTSRRSAIPASLSGMSGTETGRLFCRETRVGAQTLTSTASAMWGEQRMSARIVAGRYVLAAWLGAGTAGHVYRARDQLLHRTVAVKHVRGALIPLALRAARLSAGLTHPGIIKIYNIIEDRGSLWIVMNLVDGPSMARARHSSGRLPAEFVAKIGRDILLALTHAHEKGIVHGNLKPQNILMDGNCAVLTDFSGNQNPGLDFVPPELLRRGAATERGDLWSVGALLRAAAGAESALLYPVIDGLMKDEPAQRMSAATAIQLLRGWSTTNAVANGRTRRTVV
ncbi:serine/threonine-protein kinase [Nonomuraea sp. NPDC049504]|uniref:serine/threonine-protein kinase n=1 Tax=Nonomuraea sp. NPDC049504 TaxID=3154729 RepID=UPI003412E5DA